MRVVLDTNVIVSGVLTPVGRPGQLLDLVLDGVLELIAEPRIVDEYRKVLHRPHLKLDRHQVGILLDVLEDIGIPVVGLPWPERLPDPDDEVFIAAAYAGQAVLVTGNRVDYPEHCRRGVVVVSPRECLEQLRQSDP